ncbi:MAG: penicillin-binding protein, partial [Burkholderiaceae bacterium]|nr:penicillin-binding protein [Burkholderiaceae bacterium]
AQYEQAKNEHVKIKTDSSQFGMHAEYVAEMARQLVYEQYKEDTYTRGLNVYTTITKADQDAAYLALRKGVMDYEKRHGYRGPEGHMEIPASKEEAADAIETELADHPESDDILPAVVLEASPKSVRAALSSGDEITITGPGLTFAAGALAANAAPNRKIKRGSIIRVSEDPKGWSITQMPQVESAFIAVNTQDGAIRALVGGFDFNRNKFNHVTQAWRQPGSSFKPFIYSASLERGFSPSTMISDTPVSFSAGQTGGQAWEPKNYDGKYDGPMTMRRGLTKSKNMISVRILNKIGAQYGQEYITRFGFEAAKHPAYLTMALGAGSVTPYQMAAAYSVFANGGYKINPYIISKVTTSEGKVLSQAQPEKAGSEALRVIDERNAFLMDSMMKDVVRFGTATKAMSLGRSDLAGKTGTTNDSHDAWFAGYQPKIAAVAWIGFDQPKNLGSRETGGGLALPIWIGYMEKALKNVPVEARPVPEGMIQSGGEYYYVENPPGTGVRNLGTEGQTPKEDKPGSDDKEEDEQ